MLWSEDTDDAGDGTRTRTGAGSGDTGAGSGDIGAGSGDTGSGGDGTRGGGVARIGDVTGVGISSSSF